MRTRLIAFALVVPLLVGFMVVVALELPVTAMLIPLTIAAILVSRCWRIGLARSSEGVEIRRVLSTEVVSPDAVVAARFGEPLSPGFPTALVVQLRDGRSLKVRGVSATRNVIPIEGTNRDPAAERVAEFFAQARQSGDDREMGAAPPS